MTDLSYKTDDEADERLNPATANARNLQNQETQAGNQQIDDLEKNYNAPSADPAQENANIAKARDQEKSGAGWKNNVNPNGPGKKKEGFKGFMKKKGPVGLIITMLLGGGGGIGLLLSPAGALIHFKEVLVNKLDSMSSISDVRANLIMPKRVFATSGSCTIKIRCRFSGLTTRQIERLRIQGGEVLDKNGKPITQNKVTRKWTGGVTLEYTNEEGHKVRVTSANYKTSLLKDPKLRSLGRSVFAPRFWSFNDKIARKIRVEKRLVENPKWGAEGDEKDGQKAVLQASRGENGPTVGAEENAKTTTDKNGKTVNVPQDPGSQGLDFGQDAQAIQDEASRLGALADADPSTVPSIPGDVGGAATMPEYPSSQSGFSKALGFLNPLGFLTGLCTIYQMTNIIVLTAKTYMLANAMRYASQFLSTADKLKDMLESGTNPDELSDDVNKAMTQLETENKYGEAFGESFTYNFVQYGNVTEQPLGSSAEGNDVIRMLSTILNTTNDALGGGSVVRTACNILTNPFVQGALVLTSFIPGGGQVAGALGKLAGKGGMAAAKKLIEEKISAMVAKTLTKDALKTAAKAAGRGLWKLAKSPALAMFLGSYIMARYGVPYIARAISGTDMANADGLKAADTIGNGFDATNSATAQSKGLVPLKKKQYSAFKSFNDASTAAYVADMRAQSNPGDVNDPYSLGNSLASAFYSFGSQLDFFKNTKNILSAPATILASLNPGKALTSSALADNTSDQLDYCQDEYLQGKDFATSPWCNVEYGFPDINMLETLDPEANTEKMYADKQIDENGDPVPGSDYEKFKSTCLDNTENKFYGNLGEPDQHIDESCADEKKNDTTQIKDFRIYGFDSQITDAMDGDTSNDTPVENIQAYTDPNFYNPTDGSTSDVATADSMQNLTSSNTTSTAQSQQAQQPILAALNLACSGNQATKDLSDFKPFTAPFVQGDQINNWELGYNA